MQKKTMLDTNIWGLRTTQMNKKDRTQLTSHHRLQELYKKRDALSKVSNQWFNKVPGEAFLGYAVIIRKKQRVLYDMHKDFEQKSYSIEYPDLPYARSTRQFLRALRNEKLPEYIYHPDYQEPESQEVLQGRLKGEYLEIPYHQDLVDERIKLNHQFRIIGIIIKAYESILEDYVKDKKNKSTYSTTEILIYTIEGHDYYFKNYNNDKTMLTASSIERIE